MSVELQLDIRFTADAEIGNVLTDELRLIEAVLPELVLLLQRLDDSTED